MVVQSSTLDESDGIAELSGPDTGHQDTVVPYRCLSKPG